MRQDEAQLLASDNIFALFVLANYYVNITRKDLQKRLELKEKIMELGLERNISSDKIDRFFYFIDNIMKIPLNLQEEFNDFILSKNKIEPDMPSVLFEKQEYWRGVFAAAVREDLEKERQEREKERQEHEKERQEREKEREKLVLKLYVEIQWSADKIADVLEIPIEDVKRIIAEYIKKQTL
jgi:DNA-directed RNA polymerase specialized sigma subunit